LIATLIVNWDAISTSWNQLVFIIGYYLNMAKENVQQWVTDTMTKFGEWIAKTGENFNQWVIDTKDKFL